MLKVNIAGKQRSEDLHSGLPDPMVLIISPFWNSEQYEEGWSQKRSNTNTENIVPIANAKHYDKHFACTISSNIIKE